MSLGVIVIAHAIAMKLGIIVIAHCIASYYFASQYIQSHCLPLHGTTIHAMESNCMALYCIVLRYTVCYHFTITTTTIMYHGFISQFQTGNQLVDYGNQLVHELMTKTILQIN